MRKVWEVTTLVRVWLVGIVLKSVLSEPVDFDIVKGKAVYFGSDTKSDPIKQQQQQQQDSHLQFTEHSNGNSFQFPNIQKDSNQKHYQKGNVRLAHHEQEQRDSDTERDASRQGRNCPGVCRFIPDRDFCPTNVVEIQAYDDDDEEYYSEEEENYSDENSIEDSEDDFSDEDEEEYDDEYDDEEEDNKKNGLGQSEPNLDRTKKISSKNQRRRQKQKESSDGNKIKPIYGPPKLSESSSSSSLYVVYPTLTRFAIARNESENINSKPPKAKRQRSKVKRNRMSAKRRQREKRIRLKSRRQSSEVIRLRPPALEQEILIRWDRVVERGPFIGGDIVLPDGVALRPPNFKFPIRTWPKGLIPYTMDQSLNTCRKNSVYDAMDEIERKTCIKFVERDSERNYIDIKRALLGCSSYVGMIGGAQHLNLSTGCFSKFTVTHELIHAIGFDHEQSRKDRDKFVDIDFDNIIREKKGQFRLEKSFTGSGLPYDIRSIMHYSAFLFAKDKCEPTIFPVNEKVDVCDLGAGNGKGGMTDCDAAKINKLYKCGKQYSQKCKL